MQLRFIEGLPTKPVVDDLDILYRAIFDADIHTDLEKVKHLSGITTFIMYVDNQPVGFKMGYPLPDNPKTYYSWMGGVLDTYRNHGIASALMDAQHKKCAELGFTHIETKCSPKWPPMLKLNEKFGFVLVKEYLSSKGYKKYLLRKTLS